VNDAAHCDQTSKDGAAIYSSHQVTVDNVANATMAFVSWLSSGLRIFDIRDPAHPKEVAYYNPPARADLVDREEYVSSPGWDVTASRVWYRPKSGDIWFASFANGFQIVRLVPNQQPAAPSALIAKPHVLAAKQPAVPPLGAPTAIGVSAGSPTPSHPGRGPTDRDHLALPARTYVVYACIFHIGSVVPLDPAQSSP